MLLIGKLSLLFRDINILVFFLEYKVKTLTAIQLLTTFSQKIGMSRNTDLFPASKADMQNASGLQTDCQWGIQACTD